MSNSSSHSSSHSSGRNRTPRVWAPRIWGLVVLFALLSAASGLAQSPSSSPSVAPRPDNDLDTSLFQIVVLIGEKSGAKDSEDIPQNARKALADIKQFLPYKSYRMVDTALIRSRGESIGRMAGSAESGSLYEFSLQHSRRPNLDAISVGFQLFDVASSPKRSLLGTSFVVRKEETIVVGTSKMEGGDKALVVLFTAVQ